MTYGTLTSTPMNELAHQIMNNYVSTEKKDLSQRIKVCQ